MHADTSLVKRLRIVVPALAAVLLILLCASGAGAATVTWGVSGVTPTLNTANGDENDGATPGVTDSSSCPHGIVCSPEVNSLSKTNPILPGPFKGEDTANTPHSAEDLGVWNPKQTAPSGGQVLEVKVTGCAVKNPGATQESQGVPDTTILFQSLTPRGDEWNVDSTAGGENPNGTYPFQLPFCKTAANPSGVASSTVTTYQPLHLCLNAGDVVTLHDIGGFEDDNGVAYYPQGIPLEVLAPVSGVSTDSFIGVGANPLGPGAYGAGNDTDDSGYATEADQEVTMQVIEGTGNDAYGLCPGGFGDEPASSNAIDCDFTTSADGTRAVNPVKYPDHPFCAYAGDPVPGSNIAPAPVLRYLKLKPAVFVTARGSTITYTDSHPGLTTLRFYRVRGHSDVLVKTVRHQDKAKVSLHIGGFRPASYLVKASSVYKKLHSRTITATFKVIAHR